MIVWVLFGLELAFIACGVAGVSVEFGLWYGMIVLGVVGTLAVERLTSSMPAPAKKKAGAK